MLKANTTQGLPNLRMPVITDEAMNAVILEPPWKMGDDDMLGKMISEWEYKNKNMGCLSVA